SLCSLSITHFVIYIFFSYRLPLPQSSPLFPYTTLFRSVVRGQHLLRAGLFDKLSVWLHGTDDVEFSPERHCGQGTEGIARAADRSEEHTSELQSPYDLVCRLLLEKKQHLTPARHHTDGF